MFPATTAIPIIPQRSAAFVVLDIETGDADPQAIAAAIDAWKPPTNIKDEEKIATRRQEAAAKIAERAALLDASPILCAAIQTDQVQMIFNGMDTTAPLIEGWSVLPCGNERGLLLALRAWLDAHTSADTVLVGHNIRAFDLPKLRQAYIRHSLKLPNRLRALRRDESPTETVDIAFLFKAFSIEHRDEFCPALNTVATAFGLTNPKSLITGADCPRLYREGQFQTILVYCALDCATTTRAYQLMASSATDMT